MEYWGIHIKVAKYSSNGLKRRPMEEWFLVCLVDGIFAFWVENHALDVSGVLLGFVDSEIEGFDSSCA